MAKNCTLMIIYDDNVVGKDVIIDMLQECVIGVEEVVDVSVDNLMLKKLTMETRGVK